MSVKFLPRFTVAVALVLIAASCGGSKDDDPNVDETVDGLTAVADPANSYVLDQLAGVHKGEELFDLVQDIHGPTNDASLELNRLAPFPKIETPAGAYINAIDSRVSPSDDSRSAESITSVLSMFVEGSVADMVEHFETTLQADSWNVDDTQTGPDATKISLTRLVGTSRLKEDLEVEISEDGDNGQTLVIVEYKYEFFSETNQLERFENWHGDMPLPDMTTYGWSSISTEYEVGKIKATFFTSFDVAEGDYIESSLVDQIVASAAEKDLSYGERGAGRTVEIYVPSEVRPYEWKIDIDANVTETDDGKAAGQVTILSALDFDSPSFDAATSTAGAEQTTDSIQESATADQIESIMLNIVGPTENVTTQMRRVSDFPEIETPKNTEIVEVTSMIGGTEIGVGPSSVPILKSSELKHSSVVFLTSPSAADLETLYKTGFEVRSGWTQTAEESFEKKGDVEVIEFSYDINDADAESWIGLKIEDDPRESSGRTLVTISYDSLMGSDDNNEAHMGWAGNTPLPEGGTVGRTSIGVERDVINKSQSRVFYSMEHLYEGLTASEIEANTVKAIAGSDYGPSETTTQGITNLSHPDFDRAFVSYRGGAAVLNTNRKIAN